MIDKIEATLIERGKRYGNVVEQAACAEAIKEAMRTHSPNWGMLNPVVRQSLDMIALKISRIVMGDPGQDSWQDIEGYARLPFRDHADPEL